MLGITGVCNCMQEIIIIVLRLSMMIVKDITSCNFRFAAADDLYKSCLTSPFCHPFAPQCPTCQFNSPAGYHE